MIGPAGAELTRLARWLSLGAFSSEVDTGSRQENASRLESGAPFQLAWGSRGEKRRSGDDQSHPCAQGRRPRSPGL
ncbi:hypothetical protein CVM73_03305 [Bradyrhizobium forestalis]|uniref:Uncharacterized protein n=1 Tax=Bradyrhizobium forestalis TaxID=1419263 RepID=A0A2M8RFI7_9BRAD|nr:hypothetical protein CVM73_03305 [Bradyrhizobium forestalis]